MKHMQIIALASFSSDLSSLCWLFERDPWRRREKAEGWRNGPNQPASLRTLWLHPAQQRHPPHHGRNKVNRRRRKRENHHVDYKEQEQQSDVNGQWLPQQWRNNHSWIIPFVIPRFTSQPSNSTTSIKTGGPSREFLHAHQLHHKTTKTLPKHEERKEGNNNCNDGYRKQLWFDKTNPNQSACIISRLQQTRGRNSFFPHIFSLTTYLCTCT